MLEKPPYGSPCNSCGMCCREELCPLGAKVFPDAPAPCPALIDGKTPGAQVCGLMVDVGRFYRSERVPPDVLMRAAQYLLGAGHGCDALEENEPDNPAYRAQINNLTPIEIVAGTMARVVWEID